MIEKICTGLLIALSVMSCDDNSYGQNQHSSEVKADDVKKEKRLLNPEEFEQKYNEAADVNLLDIRTNMEVKKGYIAGMNQVDWFRDDFFKVVNNRFDKDKPLFVYCGIGGRSAECVSRLRAAGYKKVFDLDGGFKAWEKAGKPITKK